jgi:uncharacterized membrane protein
MMDLAPLLYIIRAIEMPLLFLIRGLLLVISTISVVSAIFVISPISCVDFSIILLLLRGPLNTGLKKSSLDLETLNAYVGNYK